MVGLVWEWVGRCDGGGTLFLLGEREREREVCAWRGVAVRFQGVGRERLRVSADGCSSTVGFSFAFVCGLG